MLYTKLKLVLSSFISSLNSLDVLAEFHRGFRTKINHKIYGTILLPFLPKDLLDVRLDGIFNSLEDYIEEKKNKRVSIFEKSKEILDKYSTDAEKYGTKYSCEYLVKMTRKLSELLLENFESSPFSKPADLVIEKSEKKYPLEKGNNIKFSSNIKNIGLGYALDMWFKIDASDLEIKTYEFPFGNLEPSISTVMNVEASVTAQSDKILTQIQFG